MFLRLAIIALFVALLVGCGTTQPIIQYKTVLLEPPDSLLQDCKTEEPPDPQQYVASSWPEKERLIMKANSANMKNIDLCNVDKRNLRQWKVDQKRMLDEKEKKK